MEISWLLITTVVAIWLAGIVRFWRLQSLSRNIVSVTGIDRLMVVFWLPLYVVTITVLVVSYVFTRAQR